MLDPHWATNRRREHQQRVAMLAAMSVIVMPPALLGLIALGGLWAALLGLPLLAAGFVLGGAAGMVVERKRWTGRERIWPPL